MNNLDNRKMMETILPLFNWGEKTEEYAGTFKFFGWRGKRDLKWWLIAEAIALFGTILITVVMVESGASFNYDIFNIITVPCFIIAVIAYAIIVKVKWGFINPYRVKRDKHEALVKTPGEYREVAKLYRFDTDIAFAVAVIFSFGRHYSFDIRPLRYIHGDALIQAKVKQYLLEDNRLAYLTKAYQILIDAELANTFRESNKASAQMLAIYADICKIAQKTKQTTDRQRKAEKEALIQSKINNIMDVDFSKVEPVENPKETKFKSAISEDDILNMEHIKDDH